VPSELVMAVVTALTTKGAEVLVASGKNKLAALFRVIQERFSREGTREAAILRAAIDEPDDQARRQKLIEVLARLLAEDPAFRDRLALSWREAAAEAPGAPAAVINHISGSATKAVQARDIYGDVTL
jgi:hypothetical protein